MAILKSVVDVNNGNTGWTRQNVLDALETTFANLGFNGGTAINGSPVKILPPAGSFLYCGGAFPSLTNPTTRYFSVSTNGTESYNIQENYGIGTYSIVDTNALAPDYVNYIVLSHPGTNSYPSHMLETGDKVIWNPYNIATNLVNFAGYITGQTYYVIKLDPSIIQLATTLQNALNGIEVDLTSVTGSPNSYYMLRRLSSEAVGNPGDVGYVRGHNIVNPTIVVDNGDSIFFDTNDTDNFSFFSTKYYGVTSTKELNSVNYPNLLGYQLLPTKSGPTNRWECRGWPQTDTDDGFSYGYGNKLYPTMKGEIRIVPANNTNSYNTIYPFWRYTVPASGGRSSLSVKILREPYQSGLRGKINDIVITNYSTASGWTVGDSFTIPSSALGYNNNTGNYIVGDIQFGINSGTTQQQTDRTGVCSILTTNVGAGPNMYQKSSYGHFAVLKSVNDATKTYGTTYYGFGLSTNNFIMNITSGPNWNFYNVYGTNSQFAGAQTDYGYYAGEVGLDYQSGNNWIRVGTDTQGHNTFQFASSSTPTAYPLAIRTYKAQQPQDTNFAVIQFTQTINNVIIPFATFSLHKGPLVGANVWDLNHVWNGGISNYYATSTRSIEISYQIATTSAYGYEGSSAIQNSLLREANYGYVRESGTSAPPIVTSYACNIDTDNNTNPDGYYSSRSAETITYYRNSTYDGYGGANVSASANYYKPMKGLPICSTLMPCPYYLPDDFVTLQVATSPGLTQFRPGDTVTVAAGEVYEIIVAGYETQQNGLDNIASNQSIGMLFCARI